MWSIALDKESQYHTAFTREVKQYAFTVLSQGYCDSPAMIHTYINSLYLGLPKYLLDPKQGYTHGVWTGISKTCDCSENSGALAEGGGSC